MELVLNNGFSTLSFDEMIRIDGGGWLEFGQVFLGTVLVSISPAVAVGAGIIATPPAGVAAGLSTLGLGLNLIGAGTH